MTQEEKQFEDNLVCHITGGLLSNEAESLEIFHGKKTKAEALKDLSDIVYQISDAIIAKRKEREGRND